MSNTNEQPPQMERPELSDIHSDFSEMDAVEQADNVTSITDAPSLRAAIPAEKFDITKQAISNDQDGLPVIPLERPRTDTIREEDVVIGGARRMKQHSGGNSATMPRIRDAFIDKNLSTRKAAVVERTKELNRLNIGSIEPGVIAKPVEQEPISQHPKEHPTDFEKRKQEAFLNDPRVQEVDAYINGEDLITKGEQVS